MLCPFGTFIAIRVYFGKLCPEKSGNPGIHMLFPFGTFPAIRVYFGTLCPEKSGNPGIHTYVMSLWYFYS
jgi:hypothetical protein